MKIFRKWFRKQKNKKSPAALGRYSDSDYITQQKAKFIYYLSTLLIITMVILVVFTIYVQIINPIYAKPYLPVLVPQFAALIVFILCRILLIKGHFNISANLMITASMLTVWLVILSDKSEAIGRLDTFAYMLAALTMAPLLTSKKGNIIILYSFINIVLVIIFITTLKDSIGISKATATDLILDITTSIFFIGLVGYSIFTINRKALTRAENDIKNRKITEQALAKSERKYRELADLLPQSIFETDENGVFTYVNKTGFTLFGYTQDDLEKGASLLDMIFKDERVRAYEALKHIMTEAPTPGEDYTAVRKDGSIFPVQIYTSAIMEEGKFVGIRGTVIDITERKNFESALTKSERKYRELADLLPQSVFEADINGKFTYVNKTGFTLFGYTQEDVEKGANILNMVVKDDQARVIEALKSIVTEKSTPGEDYTAVRKDGSIFPVQIYTSAIMEEGQLVGIRGTVIDITERKKSEATIKQNEELFRTVIEFAPNSIILTDTNGKFLITNEAFSQNLGFEFNEIKGKSFKDLGVIVDSEWDKEFTESMLQDGFVGGKVLKIKNKDQQENYFLVSARTIRLQNDNAILTTAVNITEKKKTENELELYRHRLEDLVKERTEELATANEELSSTNEELLTVNEELFNHRQALEKTLNELRNTQKQLVQNEKMASLGTLASGVAHEINNPLNFISGGMYAINNYVQNNLGDHIEYFNPLITNINEGIQRAASIVKGLSQFSRQTTELNEELDIHTIINNCLQIISSSISNNIEIATNFSDSNLIAIGNGGKLHQAIYNVITNSIQSIAKKGQISIYTKPSNGFIEIAITDTGMGIKNEEINKVFDPFYTTKPPSNTGLGLTTAHEIIKEINGEIEIKSKEGNGTTVFIRLISTK